MAALTAEAFDGMTAHMNLDHADSIAAYARHFAGCDDVAAARITVMDALGMTIEVESPAGRSEVRVRFDHELVDATDGRMTLVAMAKAAAVTAT